MSAIEQTPEGLRLKIILQPKASKDQIVGLHDDELKITITAPPVDGQANAHLLKFLSKTFKVPKSAIILQQKNHHTFYQFSLFYAILYYILQSKICRKVRSKFKVIFYATTLPS